MEDATLPRTFATTLFPTFSDLLVNVAACVFRMPRLNHLSHANGAHDLAKRDHWYVGVASHPTALSGIEREPQVPYQYLSVGGLWDRRFIPTKLVAGQIPRWT